MHEWMDSLSEGHHMNRLFAVCAAAFTALLVAPQTAFASGQSSVFGVPPLNLVISLAGLGVTMILLVEVIMLRKVAVGGAIAARISYVVLAIVCLGASALAQWTRNFVSGVTLDQVQIASEVFVTVAMGLFAAYFASVRRALEGFLNAMTGGELFASETEAVEADQEAEATRA
ncbi:MAG: hypothetical protein CVT67_04340 [Actinobacteria bacterium HGW-Actinobacteria-7]|jgi:hypothetical protein|nr:MAG: hypothetical protein CVT67_04340 [Actinobacteria bacterium HGW-Actinobacteria-7]